jgi:hypothetical protein
MNWDKIFSLIEKNGGKHFIVDKNEDRVFVVLPLDEYEAHLDQCGCDECCEVDDMLDEIEPELSDGAANDDVDVKSDSAGNTEEQFYIEPLE